MNETLTWNDHIKTIYKKSYKSLGIIRKASVHSKDLMFKLILRVHSDHDYCNILLASS